MLPKKLEGLERYLNELPEKIEIETLSDGGDGFILRNIALEGRYESIMGPNKTFHNLNFSFLNFLPESIYLHLVADYCPEKREAEVGVIALRKKNRIGTFRIVSMGMSNPEERIQPYQVKLTSDFLNKILDKYNFHSYYEQFTKMKIAEEREIIDAIYK